MKAEQRWGLKVWCGPHAGWQERLLRYGGGWGSKEDAREHIGLGYMGLKLVDEEMSRDGGWRLFVKTAYVHDYSAAWQEPPPHAGPVVKRPPTILDKTKALWAL